MKLSSIELKKIIAEEVNLLIEQDEDPEAATEEIPAEDEPAEEEEAGEETAGTEEVPATDAAAEEQAAELEPAIEQPDPLSAAVDNELNSLFVDFETNAMNAAKSSEENADEEIVSENYNLMRLLYEQEEIPKIDMETFAADVARLVKNYDSLLDMKKIILTKALDYIGTKYDENYAGELMDILDFRYDLSLEDKEDDEVDPLAVGASAAAAATA